MQRRVREGSRRRNSRFGGGGFTIQDGWLLLLLLRVFGIFLQTKEMLSEIVTSPTKDEVKWNDIGIAV